MALSMSQIHWDYFILLEEDVIRILHYIEPTEANYGAYGAELVKVYLSICSEIDVAFKDLNHLVRRYESADWGTVNNISGARKMVHARFSQQFRFSWIAIGTSGIVVNPWSSWWADDGTESAMNPEWWVSYNNVKHHRLDSYAEANLWNVLQALSGLFILISRLYRYEYEHNAEEAPRYLPAPQRLAFSSRGIEIGSSEPTYVVGTSLCVSPGFHVDKLLQLPLSGESDIRDDCEQGVSSIRVNA